MSSNGFSIRELVKLIVMMIGFSMMVFCPLAQVGYELFHWLNTAEWANVDWFDVLDQQTANALQSSDLKGLNVIVHYVLDSWISLPFAVVGGAMVAFTAD